MSSRSETAATYEAAMVIALWRVNCVLRRPQSRPPGILDRDAAAQCRDSSSASCGSPTHCELQRAPQLVELRATRRLSQRISTAAPIRDCFVTPSGLAAAHHHAPFVLVRADASARPARRRSWSKRRRAHSSCGTSAAAPHERQIAVADCDMGARYAPIELPPNFATKPVTAEMRAAGMTAVLLAARRMPRERRRAPRPAGGPARRRAERSCVCAPSVSRAAAGAHGGGEELRTNSRRAAQKTPDAATAGTRFAPIGRLESCYTERRGAPRHRRAHRPARAARRARGSSSTRAS